MKLKFTWKPSAVGMFWNDGRRWDLYVDGTCRGRIVQLEENGRWETYSCNKDRDLTTNFYSHGHPSLQSARDKLVEFVSRKVS